ncbi:MAG: DUF1109 domain-containing protein [Beijerinckiaceae bacterium]|nr:DUF1109 domain-containing protein [Beijerinckiaceae bacterium]
MKTDDLIRALAEDAPSDTGPARNRALLLLAASSIIVAIVFVLLFNLRADLAGSGAWPTLRKLAVTLLLLGAGARGATLLMQPDARLRDALIWLAAPIAAILTLIGVDVALNGNANLGARAMGATALQCLASVSLLSLAPLAAFLYGLREGATTRPDIAGALAGVAAGGIAASLYALHCTDDGPLFVGVWYGLAIMLVGAAGWFAGRRILQW